VPRGVAANPERQVDVRPFVACAGGIRAGDGGGGDALVRLGEGEQALPDLVPLLDGEHRSTISRD
jgi:hypothetical protein